MMWGQTVQERLDKKERRKQANRRSLKRQKPKHVFFAWIPQRLDNGRWVWLEYVWQKSSMRFIGCDTYTFVSYHECKITFLPVED